MKKNKESQFDRACRLAVKHNDKPLSVQSRILGYSQSNRAVDVPSSKAIANG